MVLSYLKMKKDIYINKYYYEFFNFILNIKKYNIYKLNNLLIKLLIKKKIN